METITIENSKWKNFTIQLKRSYAVSKKDMKIYYNKAPVLIQGILFPIILFFAFTIGRQVAPVYMVSGLMAMVAFLISTLMSPVTLPWETAQKTLERLITSPISIKTILLGNVWSSLIYGAAFSLIPLIIGLILVPSWISITLPLIILGCIVAGFMFSSFSLILSAPPSDTVSTSMILTLIIKFPLIIISPLFMPISSPFYLISPLTYFIDIVNFGLTGLSVFGPYGVLLDFGILFVLGFGFLFLAFALHKKTLEKRFRG